MGDIRVTINPDIRSGEPCLYGTRLTVADVIDIFGQHEEHDYDLKPEHLDICFMYYFIHNPTNITPQS